MRRTYHPKRHQSGFSLLESLIALSLISLVLLGSVDLYVNATRLSAKTQAEMSANLDAANVIQFVIMQAQEALSFALPGETTAGSSGSAVNYWTAPPAAVPTGTFQTTYSGETILTAMEITNPAVLTASNNGYTASLLPNIGGVPDTTIHVCGASASYSSTFSLSTLDSSGGSTPAITYLIYRGDPDGTPDADPTGNTKFRAGAYLWEYNYASGTEKALCKSIAPAPNAVQFIRPLANVSNGVGTPLANQIQVKIVSGYYSPINTIQTSQANNGSQVSQLSGECVYMRDHGTQAISSSANTQSSNNVTKYN